jgi:hypothetical protein
VGAFRSSKILKMAMLSVIAIEKKSSNDVVAPFTLDVHAVCM